MPILIAPLPDPTDRVIPGEQMRQSVEDYDTPEIGGLMQGAAVDTDWLNSELVTFADAWPPMNSMVEIDRVAMRRQKDGILQMRVNAGVATPCGAWIWRDYAPLLAPLLWASPRWALSGTTRDNVGAALGSCRMMVFDVGHLAVGSPQALIAEGYSDGSGVFSIEVPQNTAYELVVYLPGSPDRAGVSVFTLTPTAI